MFSNHGRLCLDVLICGVPVTIHFGCFVSMDERGDPDFHSVTSSSVEAGDVHCRLIKRCESLQERDALELLPAFRCSRWKLHSSVIMQRFSNHGRCLHLWKLEISILVYSSTVNVEEKDAPTGVHVSSLLSSSILPPRPELF